MKLTQIKESFPGQPEVDELVAAVSPTFKEANKEHDENVETAEEAMKANEEAIELVGGDNTKEKETKVTEDSLKKMHLSEDIFPKIFSDKLNENLDAELKFDLKSDVYNALGDVCFTYRDKGITEADMEEAIEWFMIHFFEDEDLDESFNDKKVYDLALRLNTWAKDYDYYDYMDYSGGDEEDLEETAKSIMAKGEELGGIINYLKDQAEEMAADDSFDKRELKEVNDLIADLTKYLNESVSSKKQTQEVSEDFLDDVAKKVLTKESIEEDLKKTLTEAEEIDYKSAFKLADEFLKKYPKNDVEIYNTEANDKYYTIQFLIDGDWKHDHLAFDFWMQEKAPEIFEDFTIKFGGSSEIGDSESDWYEAIHTYFFVPKAKEEPAEEKSVEEETIEDDGFEDEFEADGFDDDSIVTESLKYHIAKEQVKRYNEGKMPKNWYPNIYLENLLNRKHITEEQKSLLEKLVKKDK